VNGLPIDVTSSSFAARFGQYLNEVRRERGMRIRHLSDRALPGATLRAIEKGTEPLTPMLVAQLSARYGADLAEVFPTREPVVLLATGTLSAGGADESFIAGDVDSILEAYLRLVKRLRGDHTDHAITLRREDLIDIADQLGRPRPEIVDRVAVLMGATGDERRAMVDLYLAGAFVVGLAT